MKRILLLIPILLLILPACQPAQKTALELARSTENSVEVIISLSRADDGQVYISATFNPVEKKLHLYSKDTPRSGVEGLGRPALLELPGDSVMRVTGALTENISATEQVSGGPDGLMVYPAGAVTLHLPVDLPPGADWFDAQVIVTYMACTDYICRPPVEDKIISIRVPQNDAFN